MGLRRRGLVDDGDERAEKSRRNGAVMAALFLVLLLVLLTGAITVLAVIKTPVRVGGYYLLGPSVENDRLIWFGNGSSPFVSAGPLGKTPSRTTAATSLDLWITTPPTNKLPSGVQTYEAMGIRDAIVVGRPIFDVWGFRIIGP